MSDLTDREAEFLDRNKSLLSRALWTFIEENEGKEHEAEEVEHAKNLVEELNICKEEGCHNRTKERNDRCKACRVA